MELIDKYLGEGKKDYVTNVWGNLQLIKNIKDELKQAKKSKKDVWHSQTNKTMKYTDFVKKTEKILKGVNEAKGSSTPMECMECGHKFKKKLTKNTVEVKCPKCKGYDTDVA